jgi:TRAP-type mannitol/chloroaromatic compound transport system permease small subunit
LNEGERAPALANATDAARSASLANRYCDAIDRLNCWIGRAFALAIFAVTLAVLYEVLSRGVFGQGTTWSNETTIYLSAVAYLVGGGYALAHRRHVRIDLIHARLSPRTQRWLDAFTFLFFVLYVGALAWVGTTMGWTSFSQGEGTGTPWNPPIWPVKLAIPLAAVLLLLQGVANLLRDMGVARSESRAT